MSETHHCFVPRDILQTKNQWCITQNTPCNMVSFSDLLIATQHLKKPNHLIRHMPDQRRTILLFSNMLRMDSIIATISEEM